MSSHVYDLHLFWGLFTFSGIQLHLTCNFQSSETSFCLFSHPVHFRVPFPLAPVARNAPYTGELQIPYVSISWGCCNKPLQTRWLKQQNCIVSQFWRVEVQEQDAGRFRFSRVLSPWHADGHSLVWPLFCACVSLRRAMSSSSRKDAPGIGPGPHPKCFLLTSLPL